MYDSKILSQLMTIQVMGYIVTWTMITTPWITFTLFLYLVITVIDAQPILQNSRINKREFAIKRQNAPARATLQPQVKVPSSWRYYSPQPPSNGYTQTLPPYYAEQVKSPQEPTARERIAETIKKDIDQVGTSLSNLNQGLQQDDDILDKIRAPSESAADLLRDLKLSLDPDYLSNSLDLLNTLVNTLQDIATQVIEQDDDTQIHQLLLDLSENTHTLVLDFSPSSSSTPNSGVPDLTGLDSAVADQEEP
ncbi:hypothetical protein BC941DRAFT_449019 [Chlamydoabsidia padenii]|nr:hypothetical protein BC941DRAFT_449019 [Chlamydoabsidia padenii]